MNLSLLFQEKSPNESIQNSALNKDDSISNVTANDERINGLKNYVNGEKRDLLKLKPKAEWNRSDIERDTAVDDLVFSDKNSIFSESELLVD